MTIEQLERLSEEAADLHGRLLLLPPTAQRARLLSATKQRMRRRLDAECDAKKAELKETAIW